MVAGDSFTSLAIDIVVGAVSEPLGIVPAVILAPVGLGPLGAADERVRPSAEL